MNAHLKGHAFSPSLARIFADTHTHTHICLQGCLHTSTTCILSVQKRHLSPWFLPAAFLDAQIRSDVRARVPQSQSVLVPVNLYLSGKSFFTKDFYGHKCLTLIFVVWLFVRQDGAERRSEETNSGRSRKTSFQAVLALGILIKFPERVP